MGDYRGGQSDAEQAATDDLVSSQVRKSTLLLVGRLLQLVTNLAVQLIIVRYLSKAGYGAFAYALATVTLGETFVLFGLDRAVGTSIPMALERRDTRTALGVLVLSIGTVCVLGLILVVTVVGSQGAVTHFLISDQKTATLLVLMIALAPILAVEDLLIGVFGVLARARAIFFRCYVLASSFRLAAGVLLVVTGSSVYFLAVAYVVSAALGLLVTVTLLLRILRSEGLLTDMRPRLLRFPVRKTFAFTVPLLTTDLVNVLLFSSDAILLGHFRGPVAVASFRVIGPLASLCLTPASIFAMLYVPAASRLFAREDRAGIKRLHSRTSFWIAVLCFPIFAFSLSGATGLTTLFYGARYESSAMFLSIIAVGYYAQAVLGFSGLTLMVFGRVRLLTALNVLAMVFNLALNLVLIPRFGALGAAIGTGITLVFYNVLRHAMARKTAGVRLVTAGSLRPLAVLVAIAGMLGLARLLVHDSVLGLVIATVSSAVVIIVSRHHLDIGNVFPAVARLPGIRWFISLPEADVEAIEIGETQSQPLTTESGEAKERLPSVSVVVATYNRRHNLLPVIRPLLADRATSELVVVVDGGDDGSLELLTDVAETEPRLRPVLIDNRGCARAQQAGVELVSGEVVLLLDDDVVAAPGLVTGHARRHAESTGRVVVGYMPIRQQAHGRRGGFTSELYAREYERACRRYEQHPEEILRGMWGGNVSLRRADCLRVHVSSEAFTEPYHMDRDLGIRCFKAGLVGVFDRSLLAEHVHSRSLDGFLRDSRNQGAGRALAHILHSDLLGPLDPSAFETGLPAPMRWMVRSARGRLGHALLGALLRLLVAAAGRGRLHTVEVRSAQLLRRVEMQFGSSRVLAGGS